MMMMRLTSRMYSIPILFLLASPGLPLPAWGQISSNDGTMNVPLEEKV